MLTEFFNKEVNKFTHLSEYLDFKTLKKVFSLADKHHGNNNFKRDNGIIYGQYDARNEFTAAFGAVVQGLEQDDVDRIISFYRIFDESREKPAYGFREAMRESFKHFDKCYNEFGKNNVKPPKLAVGG